MINILPYEATSLTIIAQNSTGWTKEDISELCQSHDALKIAYCMAGIQCCARKELRDIAVELKN